MGKKNIFGRISNGSVIFTVVVATFIFQVVLFKLMETFTNMMLLRRGRIANE
jgi:hypothetical protein